MLSSASVGPAVDAEIANRAPILDVSAPDFGPALTTEPIPGLPPELQPLPGDILLSKAFWPWEDLGARGIPESWLYMSRHIQGSIAMLAVQTPAGPKLVNADADGRISSTAPAVPSSPKFNNARITLNAGQTSQIDNTVTGSIVTLHYLSVANDGAGAAGGLSLRRSDDNSILWLFSMSIATPSLLPFSGFELPPDVHFYLSNDTAATISFLKSAMYSQRMP